jgi:hypothetical protein
VRRISRTMFVRAAERMRRPGLFRAENDPDACRSFAAVEWHYLDRLLGTLNQLKAVDCPYPTVPFLDATDVRSGFLNVRGKFSRVCVTALAFSFRTRIKNDSYTRFGLSFTGRCEGKGFRYGLRSTVVSAHQSFVFVPPSYRTVNTFRISTALTSSPSAITRALIRKYLSRSAFLSSIFEGNSYAPTRSNFCQVLRGGTSASVLCGPPKC